MRHRTQHRKLGLPSDQRKHLLNNLVRQMVMHGRVHTTLYRAKEVRPLVEKLVTTAKTDTLHARRLARRVLVGHSARQTGRRVKLMKPSELEARSLITGEDLVKHLFDKVAPRFKERNGGYTRIVRTGYRRGDAAPTALLAFVE
ncbi:MAG: 50S ribosomal protein L17 [Fimbriimonadia bacterium]|jgi:large subunit ribosomal protein L17